MTTGSIGPGTVIAGRYRLDDLLAESLGARFWRATDTILARSVAIHALPSEDPRAPGLLDAARLSATVVDAHLLRVLDCDDDDGITWVVNEWGDGISLDLMLQQGTLPPSRAAWLTREVAEAIAAGHAQGVAHGRLNPEAVLVTHAGAVKLIGYVVDASLLHPQTPDPLYGELDAREADVINLAGILYAALTGRWPGVAHSAVPAAPRESHRPLRPRQVRAGVPRTLDAICDRVLHKEASLHVMPIETAHEIAAALSDYVGDPSLTAPLDAAEIHSESTVSLHRDTTDDKPDDDPGSPEDRPDDGSDDGPDEHLDRDLDWDLDATQAAIPLPPGVRPAVDPRSDPDPEPDPASDRGSDPDATQFYPAPDEGTVSLSPLQPPAAASSPPPPFPDTPERPLFADSVRRVPATAQTFVATSSGWADPPSGTGGTAREQTSGKVDDTGHGSWHRSGRDNDQAGFWPFETDPEDDAGRHTGKEGHGWLRTAVVIGVLLVLVGVMAIAFNRGRQDGSSPSGGSETDATSSPSAQSGRTLQLAGVSDFDPESDDPQENPDEAPQAIDGDTATSWTTSTYYNDPALGGLKSGVGLVVDLDSEQQVSSVTVRLEGSPTSLEVYAAEAGTATVPETLEGFVKVGSQADAPELAEIELDEQPKTRYLLVWLTKLPPVSGGFRGEIAEITVTS